jgi:hypothetical protein
MNNNKGFGKLVSVKDYWKKLNWEHNQLKKDSDNTYLAFNFSITAYYLLEWVAPKPVGTQNPEWPIIKKNITYLKICEQLANGAKHFEISSKRHNSVKSMESDRYVEDGYVEEGYFEEPIIITLSDNSKIKILDFAESLMVDWEKELKSRKLIN